MMVLKYHVQKLMHVAINQKIFSNNVNRYFFFIAAAYMPINGTARICYRMG